MTGRSEWQTRVGQVWAQEWRRTDRALGGVAERLNAAIEACAPRSGHAVDVGCGAGSTTLALAAMRPDLRVTGLDLSPDLLGAARMRGEGHGNVAFAQGDALAILPALEPLDMIVSRHGVMFFDDPLAAFARMRAAMRPGAALVFSCFRARAENDWAVALDAAVGAASSVSPDYTPGPFGLADHGFTRDLLGRAGWTNIRAAPHDVAYRVGGGGDPVEDALGFFARIGPAATPLANADPGERSALETRLRSLLGSRVVDGAIDFTAAIWIWTATAGEAA
ncbi:trans-aconitate 2-methyltransferase [uncultured Sphingomonas sp.]|uniref:class I SAM-dependent methyltransferase n=1 Tax=uncultured Sphingomonas sp. TaxID=158754 RepID=UPI002613A3BE|nr:class I SAM-dependent methyltransferase [uncultured Sphingomonas sp.]